MKKKINYYILTIVLFISVGDINAQDSIPNQGNVDLNVELVNRYIWRGLLYCSKPSIQPYLAYTNANKNLSFGAWGSYSNSTNYGEVDLFITYSAKYMSLTIYDYFLMDETAKNNHYFEYRKKTTKHSYEAALLLSNFKIPLQLTSSIFFYGNDRDINGDNYYSLYFEAAYNFSIANHSLNVFVGGSPNEGLYGTSPGIVNMGCSLVKHIKLSDNYNLPLKGSFIFNPKEENIYFVIGLTI